MRQIIAIGGGGFGREIKDLKIEKYIVEQCRSDEYVATGFGWSWED